MDKLFSHPVNVVPSMDIPDYLPLESGQLACRTCHEDEEASTHAGARLGHTPMLRGSSNGREFCRQCHAPSERSRSAQHGYSMGLAHLAWPASKSPMGSRPARTPVDQTQLCMGCHDGTLARDAGMQAGVALSPFGPSQGEHPVRVRYRSQGEITLRPLSSLDRRIHLFDGQVGCTSCHSPFSRERKLLVMSGRDGRLCLSCHVI